MIACLELLQLKANIGPEVLNCFCDGLQHLVEFAFKSGDLSVDNVVIHLLSRLLIDQIVMDICLLGESFHLEAHSLLVNELGNVDYVSVYVMAAVLFLKEAGRAGESLGALRMLAEVFECLRGVLLAADLVIEFLCSLYFDGVLHFGYKI